MRGVGAGTHSMAAEFARRLARNRLAVAGGAVILVLFVVAALPREAGGAGNRELLEADRDTLVGFVHFQHHRFTSGGSV